MALSGLFSNTGWARLIWTWLVSPIWREFNCCLIQSVSNLKFVLIQSNSSLLMHFHVIHRLCIRIYFVIRLYVLTVSTYRVKTIRVAPYIIACSMRWQCWHTLDFAKLAFSAYQFLIFANSCPGWHNYSFWGILLQFHGQLALKFHWVKTYFGILYQQCWHWN